MKRRFIIISVLAFLLILLFGARRVYDGVYYSQNAGISTIKCHYMMYACGDCYPQWRIDSFSAIKNGLGKLIGKDFYVFYKGKEIEENFPDSIDKCVICYDFYFNGKMKKTLSDKFKFEAEAFQIKLDRPDCCN